MTSRRKPRLGVDVDGVLANFNGSFRDVCFGLFGKPGHTYIPQDWDWRDSGLSPEQIAKAWREVRRSEDFWLGLGKLAGTDKLAGAETWAELFFVTSRIPTRGLPTVAQTELWLRRNFGLADPYVTVVDRAGDKIVQVEELELDAIIDDKTETYAEAARIYGNGLWTFRAVRPWNRPVEGAIEVDSLNEFLDFMEEKP